MRDRGSGGFAQLSNKVTRGRRKTGYLCAADKLAELSGENTISWMRKAAERGDSEAQYELGALSEQGRGVGLDYGEAVRWYGYAAEQGHGQAQYSLGLLYELGRGVIQDYVHAYMWTNIAASQATSTSLQPVIEARERIATKATPGQIARGQGFAGAWKPRVARSEGESSALTIYGSPFPNSERPRFSYRGRETPRRVMYCHRSAITNRRSPSKRQRLKQQDTLVLKRTSSISAQRSPPSCLHRSPLAISLDLRAHLQDGSGRSGEAGTKTTAPPP